MCIHICMFVGGLKLKKRLWHEYIHNLGERYHLITRCGQIGVYMTVTPLGGQETCTRVWKRGMSSYYQGLEKKTRDKS